MQSLILKLAGAAAVAVVSGVIGSLAAANGSAGDITRTILGKVCMPVAASAAPPSLGGTR